MAPEILKSSFRLGVMVGGCGFVMIFLQPRNSPEFVLSVCSTLIGAALMLGVVLLMRLPRS